jgi:F0F1-type ATP synthase assembly protein I
MHSRFTPADPEVGEVNDMSRKYLTDSGGANEQLQENLQRSEPRILASYALVGSILLLGAIGYGVDRWARTSPWLLLVGLAAGIVFGFYNLLSSLKRNDAS